MNHRGILLISAGSKVAIVRIAKESARRRGLALHVCDRSPHVPSRHFADQFVALDDRDPEAWTSALLNYCSVNGIGLAIPTRHADLETLSAAAPSFRERGVALSLSGPETLAICLQKSNTDAFLRRVGAPCPRSILRSDFKESDAFGWPLFAKPATGAAGKGVKLIASPIDLGTVPDDWILQTVATGDEYTVNLYVGRDGAPRCAIPHRRIAVESGEVTQARVERVSNLIDEAMRIASCLPDAQGILNLQAFRDPNSGALQIIEINPRIGGGFPLAHQAKGHYIEWLCQEWLDQTEVRPFDRWTENLRMLRFREAIFEVDAF